MAHQQEKLPFAMPKGDDKKLIPWLNQKVEIGRAVMPDTQMKLNLAFVLGHQWLWWDTHAKQYRKPTFDPNEPNAPVRISVNKIGGLVERTVAKLTKNAPLPECRPVSDDDSDVSAARVGTRILTAEMERIDWRAFLTDFLFWPTTLGWSYVHAYWDPDAGDVAGSDELGEVRQGETCVEAVPAFELAVEPTAKYMSKAKWCIRTTSMTREAAWEKWGVELPGDSEGRSLAMEVLEMSERSDQRQADWVKVHQLWMLPCRAAPSGCVVTWSGTKILENKKAFPYKHEQLPFVQCDLIPGLGTREGRTWVNDLIPIQTDYNDARSREATIRRTLTPKILAPAGSVDPDRIGSRVEVITYMPTGAPPTLMSPDSGWAQQHEMGMERANAEMGERAGVGEASAGSAPSGMPAAAILALQEADETKLAVSATQLASFIAKLGWQILMLDKQYWTEERTVRVYSEENVLDVKRYSKADIADKLDVHVASESALPRSKSARVQLLFELQARMPDLIDPQTLIRALDMPGVDFLVRSLDMDSRKQARETSDLIQGINREVDAFDNHAVHLTSINNFRKTLDYEQLDPQIRAVVDAHAAVHSGLVLRQMGVPIPDGTAMAPDPMQAQQQAEMVRQGRGAVQGSPGSGPEYMDPTTGAPPDPLAVAAGQTPSALSDSTVGRKAGIGQGAGQPGRVPGVPVDQQAASMGN